MPVNNYKDLVVWKKSMDLVEQVYRLTSNFPKEEKYALTDQLKRAVFLFRQTLLKGNKEQPIRILLNSYQLHVAQMPKFKPNLK